MCNHLQASRKQDFSGYTNIYQALKIYQWSTLVNCKKHIWRKKKKKKYWRPPMLRFSLQSGRPIDFKNLRRRVLQLSHSQDRQKTWPLTPTLRSLRFKPRFLAGTTTASILSSYISLFSHSNLIVHGTHPAWWRQYPIGLGFDHFQVNDCKSHSNQVHMLREYTSRSVSYRPKFMSRIITGDKS